jgi:hypothetical protein
MGAGSTYAVAATGGSKDAVVVSHSHNITDLGHTHTYGASNNWGSGQQAAFDARNVGSFTSGNSTTGISIDTAGVSGTNANLPPYYALAYIMKT